MVISFIALNTCCQSLVLFKEALPQLVSSPLSGVHTVRFKNELERNITIKLGYANAKIFRSKDKKCQRPVCYTSQGSSKEDTFVMNGFKYELVSDGVY